MPFNGETPVEIAMKHLSQVPAAPSTHRPEIPRDLDYVALRALAKDPADRYHSAEEMDSDLERIARGIGVSAETAEAATTVLSRDGRRRGGDDGRGRRDLHARPLLRVRRAAAAPARSGRGSSARCSSRSRSSAAGSRGQELESRLDAAKPVAVPDVEGSVERLAVQEIQEAGLEELVERRPNDDGVKPGIVFEQDPQPGERIERGNFVTIVVSTGPSKVRVPTVVGESRDRAVSELTAAGLEPNVVQVNSLRAGQHRARDGARRRHRGDRRYDRPRQRLERAEADRGAERHRHAFESAESQLQGLGFAVSRNDVEDAEQPAGIVVGQTPAAGTQRRRAR